MKLLWRQKDSQCLRALQLQAVLEMQGCLAMQKIPGVCCKIIRRAALMWGRHQRVFTSLFVSFAPPHISRSFKKEISTLFHVFFSHSDSRMFQQ